MFRFSIKSRFIEISSFECLKFSIFYLPIFRSIIKLRTIITNSGAAKTKCSSKSFIDAQVDFWFKNLKWSFACSKIQFFYFIFDQIWTFFSFEILKNTEVFNLFLQNLAKEIIFSNHDLHINLKIFWNWRAFEFFQLLTKIFV